MDSGTAQSIITAIYQNGGTLQQILTALSGISGVDYELRVSPYKANKVGTGYTTGDFITRTDIIIAVTGVIVSTLWFNETQGTTIAAPPIADLDPYVPPSSVTVSNAFNLEATQLAMSAKLPATLGQKADAASLAITISTEGTAQLGSLTETAPATDTASSGLNGRLQRIAQRITSLIALFRLGQGTMAQSLAVTVASDQSAIPVTLPSGTQTPTASTATDSTGSPVAAGATQITFTTNSTFTGTILGVARNASTSYVISAVPGKTLTSVAYTVTAGSVIIDKTV